MLNMANSYIIDVFLSGAIWVLLTYMFFDVMARVKDINQLIPPNILPIAIGQMLKLSCYLAAPFVAIWLFLCWRFASLMIISATFGIGGVGLLIFVGIGGIGMIWITSLLVCLRHSRFIDAGAVSQMARQARDAKQDNRPGFPPAYQE